MKNLTLSVFAVLFTLTSIAAPITVITAAPSSITNTTATFAGSVSANLVYIEKGVVWSYTSTIPTTGDNKILMGTGAGNSWSRNNNGPFTPGTLIYVRAYAIFGTSTFYGAVKSFTTNALAGTGAIYDFESASGTYTGWGTSTLTATNTSSSSSMTVTSVADSVYQSSVDGFSDGGGRIGAEGLYFGFQAKETQVTFAMQGNKTFDLNSLYIDDETGNDIDYVITSSKGSITVHFPSSNTEVPTTFIDIADNANAAYFKGITSFVITPTGGAFIEMDHIVMQNITSLIILPLRLTSFNGYMQNQTAHLNWSTANESNTKEMQVERSFDGKNFTTASIIATAGKESNQYHFDETLSSNEQKIYYRIKRIDNNGKASVSNVITLTAATISNKNIQLYPNPATGTNISLSGNATAGNIIIYNLHGEKLKQQAWKAGEQINIKGLATGSYILQLVNGNETLNSRFVKE